VIDIATLTGAVLQSTGKVHAGVVSNTEIVEIAATRAGLISGETCFPLLYAPELLRKEFKSVVADMKNSVKDRNNSQSSCAAIFVAAHLPDPAPPWLHIDIAGTAWDGERRLTGWGVGLLLALGAGPGPGE
jgi:probable aminopeptidase NPEPL1